jgi:AsmA-like protein
MGRVVGVSFRNFVLREPRQSRPIVTAPRIVMRVALLPLFRRELAFRGLTLDRPLLRVARDERGKMPWLDLILNLPFQQRSAGEFSIDLREIRIQKGDVLFTDRLGGKAPVNTRLAGIDLKLGRARTRGLLGAAARTGNTAARGSTRAGLDFELKTMVDRDGRRADFSATGRALFAEGSFDIRKAWVDANIRSDASPAALLWEYYGRPIVESAPRGNLAYRLHWEGQPFQAARVNGEVRFAGLEVEAADVFPAPVALGDGRLNLALDWKPDEIRFERLDLRSRDVTFAARGTLGSPGGSDPHLALRLTAPFLPVTALRRYVPVKLFHSPRLESLAAAVDRGEIRFASAEISGRLSELRRLSEPGQEERLRVEAEVREVGGSLGDDPSVAFSGFSGAIVLEHGVLQYKNFYGWVGESRLTQINGAQPRALSGGPLELRIKGDADLQEVRERIPRDALPPAAGKMMNALRDLGGRAGIDLLVRTDFVSDYQYEGVVALEGVRLGVGDITLSDLKGDVLVSPTEIRADRAAALLAGSAVQLRALVKDFAGEQGTFDLTLDSGGVKASEALRLLLSSDSESPGIVRGAVRYQGSLEDADKRKLTASLELVGVEFPITYFDRPFREIYGRVRLDGKTVDLRGIRAQVGGYGFALDGRWIGEDRPTFLFTLNSPEMDVEYILPHHVVPDEEWYERLQVKGKLALEKGRYEGVAFSDFKTDVALEKRIWRLENFFARADGGTVEGTGAFNDRSEPGVFTVEPKIKGVPIQDLLGWFDIGTTEITGKVELAGKLAFSGKTGAERKRSLNGVFRARIEDGVARRFQLLVRILNFMDLSRWFTLRLPNINQEGIHFRSVSGDFKITRGVYATENLFIDGDDLKITGAGELDGPKGALDFTIAVRPFPGLDRAWNYIPILGTGLAAIKNSFLVASFNVKGPVNDPSITPAPLSTLSEYFFGALAIPKGLIGIPSLGAPKAGGEPLPPVSPSDP